MSESKIKKNYEKIVSLLNQNVELEYKELLKKAKKFWEKEINIGSRKQPKMVLVKIMVYDDFFIDEDTKEKIKIERNRHIEVDGVPCDQFLNPLPKYELQSFINNK